MVTSSLKHKADFEEMHDQVKQIQYSAGWFDTAHYVFVIASLDKGKK